MPVGCEMNYVIFRKASLCQARDRLLLSDDSFALTVVNQLLSSEHADDYLSVIEDMVGFSDAEVEFWEKRLGLIGKLGYENIDFYIPDRETPICRWLEFANLRERAEADCERKPFIWDGYRYVGDPSRKVNVGATEGFVKKRCEDFPEKAQKIDMESYLDFNWDYARSVGIEPPSWFDDFRLRKLKTG
jgi:hypothetical protein